MNYIKKSIAVLLVFVVSFSSFAFLANADLKISSIDKEDTYVSYKWDGKIGADGDYHYSSGTVTRRTISVTEANVHGLLPAGSYEFGADGKMIIK